MDGWLKSGGMSFPPSCGAERQEITNRSSPPHVVEMPALSPLRKVTSDHLARIPFWVSRDITHAFGHSAVAGQAWNPA